MERTTSLGFITTDVDSEFMGLGLRPKKKKKKKAKQTVLQERRGAKMIPERTRQS